MAIEIHHVYVCTINKCSSISAYQHGAWLQITIHRRRHRQRVTFRPGSIFSIRFIYTFKLCIGFYYKYARLREWQCYDQIPTFEPFGHVITAVASSQVHLHYQLSAPKPLAAFLDKILICDFNQSSVKSFRFLFNIQDFITAQTIHAKYLKSIVKFRSSYPFSTSKYTGEAGHALFWEKGSHKRKCIPLRYGYDSIFYSIQLSVKKFWFDSTHDSQ